MLYPIIFMSFSLGESEFLRGVAEGLGYWLIANPPYRLSPAISGTKLFPPKHISDLSLAFLHFGIPFIPASWASVGKISISSTGVLTALGGNPGMLKMSGTFRATSKLLYFAHRPFSPNDQPKKKRDFGYYINYFFLFFYHEKKSLICL